MKYSTVFLASAFLGLTGFSIGELSIAATAKDNSKVNQRDLAPTQLTADQQSEKRDDVSITRTIRKDLLKEKDLSTYARNVKIITVNGLVTLKGPVRSEQERTRVLESARIVAGTNHVTDQMSVAPNKTSKKN